LLLDRVATCSALNAVGYFSYYYLTSNPECKYPKSTELHFVAEWRRDLLASAEKPDRDAHWLPQEQSTALGEAVENSMTRNS